MKMRFINMNAPMAYGTGKGIKNHTRRPMKPQPKNHPLLAIPGQTIHCEQREWLDADCIHPGVKIECPYGEPGDLLFVREPWMRCGKSFRYEAEYLHFKPFGGWKQPETMPKEAVRFALLIVSILPDCLQNMGWADFIGEGIERLNPPTSGPLYGFSKFPKYERSPSASAVFRAFWNGLYSTKPEYQCEANPWVWKIHFALLDRVWTRAFLEDFNPDTEEILA